MADFANLDPFAARHAKLTAWRALGIDPYPAQLPANPVRSTIAVVRNAEQGQQYAVSGRIKAMRGQGALIFIDLHDATGKIQIVLKQDAVDSVWFERIELLDLGDFIWVTGQLFTTNRGELSIQASEWRPLAKALHPMPDAWRGLQDMEQRQRQRYAELLVSDIARERFLRRSALVRQVRNSMADHGFIEVETATLEHVPGGADAEPFATHHNALDVDFYLRISLELQLKRALIGGIDRVFEIGKVFRNEGMSPQHLQEFTMFEFYWAYASYTQGMELAQQLYQDLVRSWNYDKPEDQQLLVERGTETVLNFAGEWPRVSYVDIVKQFSGVNVLEATEAELIEALIAHGVRTGSGGQQAAAAESLQGLGKGRLIDMLYKKTTRPHLIQPQFLIDLPVEFSPLAKKKADDPRLTERFVVVVDGVEVGNAFSELNDPLDQYQRFAEQEKLRLAGDVEAQRLDEDFLRAMSYGMPPATGFGVSIDRLVTIISGVDSIRETVLFPTMRPEEPFWQDLYNHWQ
jgi:lysyl-tRNA synthetase, class II